MTYTVKSGDTLSAILKKLKVPGWNTSAVWNKIAPQLRSKNPSRIYPGEVINLSSVVPQASSSVPATTVPTTAPEASVSRPVAEAQSAAEAAPQKDFQKDIMPFEQFFDKNLALSSSAQRSAGYYTPILQRGREGIESDYASRGLTRSSQRGEGVMDYYKDMAGQEEKMRDQLYGQVEREGKEDWGLQQGLYEDDPRGYKKNTYKMEPYEYDYPVESPGKYGKSYRDWIRSNYNI